MIESLFLDCVEVVKKQRKSKSKMLKLRDSEKQKVLELLIQNEDVLMFLYENLFP